MTIAPTREAVFSALFTHLQTACGSTFTTYSRRMMDYSAISPGLLPALILWELHSDTAYSGQGLPRNYWEGMIVVVFRNPSRPANGNPTTATPGASILNPLIDAVRAALAPDDVDGTNYTIGDLVTWCRVEGKTVVETGDTDADGRGGAVFPIRILVPSQGDY